MSSRHALAVQKLGRGRSATRCGAKPRSWPHLSLRHTSCISTSTAIFTCNHIHHDGSSLQTYRSDLVPPPILPSAAHSAIGKSKSTTWARSLLDYTQCTSYTDYTKLPSTTATAKVNHVIWRYRKSALVRSFTRREGGSNHTAKCKLGCRTRGRHRNRKLLAHITSELGD